MREILINLAAAALLNTSSPTSTEHPYLATIQSSAEQSGPFDPEDQKRQLPRPKNELYEYTLTPEQRLEDLKNGLPGIILVVGFAGTIFFIRKVRG